MVEFEWPCDRRDAHHPHTIYADGDAYPDDYDCPGVGAHPLTQIGGNHTREEVQE